MRYDGWLILARAYRIATPLHEFMQRITHREYQARLAYERELWNRPSRGDYYTMQTALEVRRVLHKHPERIKMDQFKIPFDFGNRPRPRLTTEEAAQWAKAKWFGLTGAIGRVGKSFLDTVRGK